MNDNDKKFLALNYKWPVIKQMIKAERHVYIAKLEDEIIGYMRESGRSDNYSLLEEIVVKDDMRNKGIATKLIDHFLNMYPKAYAKTNSKNINMNTLLEKKGFIKDDASENSKMINWTRN